MTTDHISVPRELLPCPFCGAIPKTSHRDESKANGGGFVAFIACYCGGYSATAHQAGYGETVQVAIADVTAKWNSRPLAAQPVGLCKHLPIGWIEGATYCELCGVRL